MRRAKGGGRKVKYHLLEKALIDWIHSEERNQRQLTRKQLIEQATRLAEVHVPAGDFQVK